MKPVELETPWLPGKRIDGITLWPFILYRRGKRSPALEAHERFHWQQALRWGVVPWYAAYVVLYLVVRSGKRRHPLERPAYEVSDAILRREHEGP